MNGLKTLLVFTGGNLVATVVGLVGSLVQARYVAPEQLGILRTFGIITSYLTFLHMGVFDGLQREIPLQMGRGKKDDADRATAACLAWILLVSATAAAGFLLCAAVAGFQHDWARVAGWLAYTFVICGTFYGSYLATLYRSSEQFILLSRFNIVEAIVGTLVLPSLILFGYYGACLRIAATSASTLYLLHRRRPLKVRPRIDWAGFYAVIRVGLPLSIIGYVATSLWMALEGTMMLKWFGLKALGLWAMATFIRTLVIQLAQNINQVLNVKIYEQYGRTSSTSDCMRVLVRPMVSAFLISLPLISLGWITMPWIIPMLIPKYAESVPMMQFMLLSMPITLLQLLTTVLRATARHVDYFISVIGGFAAFVICAYAFYKLNYGMLSLIIASLLGQIVNAIASYALIHRSVVEEREIGIITTPS